MAAEKNTDICRCDDEQVRLIFACSGGADVGHLSDAAARKMMADKCGKLFCLAGIGGDVEAIIKTTREADTILVIDGCPVDCAKKTLDRAGITGYRHFQVTSLGFDKGKTSVTDESISAVAGHGKRMICA
ncbi:putative zinc-binding protein [bacterium]|nr:putative zinc-binding protein [bacterium]